MASADVNGDGRLDLITANTAGHNVSVLLGKAGGTFQPAITSAAGSSDLRARSIFVGDINRDGKQDLLVARQHEYLDVGRVDVLLGNGNGTFQAPQQITTGVLGVAVGDLNADGKLDLVATSRWMDKVEIGRGQYGIYYQYTSSAYVNVFLGNGAGAFAAPTNYLQSQKIGIYNPNWTSIGTPAIGDFNSDGKPDVVVVSEGGVNMLRGSGTGTLLPAQSTVAPIP
jgi:hypothetical protein